jgi:hypothetical protein
MNSKGLSNKEIADWIKKNDESSPSEPFLMLRKHDLEEFLGTKYYFFSDRKNRKESEGNETKLKGDLFNIDESEIETSKELINMDGLIDGDYFKIETSSKKIIIKIIELMDGD